MTWTSCAGCLKGRWARRCRVRAGTRLRRRGLGWLAVFGRSSRGCAASLGRLCWAPAPSAVPARLKPGANPAARVGAAFFLGGRPRLKVEEVVYTPGDRFRLQARVLRRLPSAWSAPCPRWPLPAPAESPGRGAQTVSAGVVHAQISVILKDFDKLNVMC